MEEQQNRTKDLKFYSKKAIGIATFFGGPLAAGYLIRENYLSLNKPDEAKKSLIIGIFSTILIFTIIFIIPEHILNKVPNQVLPIIYTAIIYYIVEKIHGTILDQHKENGNEFYSGWKAAGIGAISLVIILIGIFGVGYFSANTPELEKYDTEIAKFSKNEAESLIFYDFLNSGNDANSLIKELDKNTIPKWKENIEIVQDINNIENLPSKLTEQNKNLLKYAELRLKAFELLKKAISEDTEKYSKELNRLHEEIDILLEKMN